MSIAIRLSLALLLLLPTASGARPPVLGPGGVFATGIPGPEGIAFSPRGELYVGTQAGQLLRIAPDGGSSLVADLGEPLAGIMVRRDGHILAAAFGGGRVWSVDPGSGMATVFAEGIAGPNFIVETRRGRVYASASTAGTIVEVTNGTPVVRASGLSFPNGLALFRDGFLYVAELTGNRVSRLPIAADGSLGPAEEYATGLTLVDGIAFDVHGNLLAVGFDSLRIVPRGSSTASVVSTDPLLNWPSNLAFGRGHGFRHRNIFLVNFGLPLGSGTDIVRFKYNQTGAALIR
jgi:sugar lactone lactonase YvrE